MAPNTVPPLILKVGGSLVQSGRIDQVVPIIAESQRAVVIVPGGGEFADKVRDLQAALHFGDGAAHRLAMLGMHQMADTLVTKHARFVIEDSLEGLFLAIADGRIPIWVPLPTLDGDDTIPATWDTTSDTIAARLARAWATACRATRATSLSCVPIQLLTARQPTIRPITCPISRNDT